MTYNCHSAASREQFSMREGGSRALEGREANKKTMQRASSMSRTASMKVGYLKDEMMYKLQGKACSPLLDDVVQTVDGLVILQAFGITPLSPSKSARELFRKCFVLSQFLEHWLVGKICDILGIVKRGWSRRPLVGTLTAARFTREYAFQGN